MVDAPYIVTRQGRPVKAVQTFTWRIRPSIHVRHARTQQRHVVKEPRQLCHINYVVGDDVRPPDCTHRARRTTSSNTDVRQLITNTIVLIHTYAAMETCELLN